MASPCRPTTSGRPTRRYVSDGQPPVFENELHILDDNGTGTYTLNYVPIDELQPAITSISAVSPNPTTTAVNGLQVTFNEPIALGTLDADDLDLSLNGGPNLITSTVGRDGQPGLGLDLPDQRALGARHGRRHLHAHGQRGRRRGPVREPGRPAPPPRAGSWTRAAPAVSTIGGVTPGPRNTPVGSVICHIQRVDRSIELRPLGPEPHRGRRLEPDHRRLGRHDHPGRARPPTRSAASRRSRPPTAITS